MTVALAYYKAGPLDLAAHLREQPSSRSRAAGRTRAVDPDRSYAEYKKECDRIFFTAMYEASKGNLSEITRRAQISRDTVRTYLRALRIGTQGQGRRDE